MSFVNSSAISVLDPSSDEPLTLPEAPIITGPDIDGDIAKRLAADGNVRNCNRRPRRAGERAARAESKGGADVNPLGLDARCGGVGLIEKTPAVLMPTAQQGAVGFGPSQLQ